MSDRLLTVHSIDTHYRESHILLDLSLAVDCGEIVALVGRNGARKTTLRSIMGLIFPTNGMITKDGTQIDKLNPHEIRKRGLSWIPEERRVFGSLTVAENLRLAAHSGADDQTERFEEIYA